MRRTEANKILGNGLLRFAESRDLLKAVIFKGKHHFRNQDVKAVVELYQNGDLKWSRKSNNRSSIKRLFASVPFGLHGDFSDIDEIEQEVRKIVEPQIRREVTRKYCLGYEQADV